MSHFERIEIKILESTFERFGTMSQRLIGLDCFFWAYACLVIWSISALFIAAMFLHLGFISPAMMTLMLMPIYLCLRVSALRKSAQSVRSGSGNSRLQNPEKAAMSLKRIEKAIVFMAMAFMGTKVLSSTHSAVFAIATIVYFFISGYPDICFGHCTPLPPGKSKLQEGFDKATRALNALMPQGARAS